MLAVGGPRAISLWRLDGTPTLSRRIPVRETKALGALFGGGQELRLGVVGRSALSVFTARSGNRLWSQSVGPEVSAASFSPDGETAAAGGSNELQIARTERDALIRRIGVSSPLRAVAFSPDGRMVAGIDVAGEFATVWSLATRDVLQRVPVPWVAQSVAFTPDGRLALGMADGSVVLELICNSRPRQVLHGPTERVFDIAFPDGGPLATAGEQGIVVFWDPSTTVLQRRPSPISTRYGHRSDLGRRLRQRSQRPCGGRPPSGDEVVTVLEVHEFTGHPAARAPRLGRRGRHRQPRAAYRRGPARRSLYEPDGRSRQLQRPGAGDRVRALALSSRDIVAWGLPGRVALWDASVARRLEPLRVQGTPVSLDFSDTGLLAVAGTNGVTLWDPLEQRPVAEPAQDVEVQAVAIARSGDVLAYASAGRVTLWDLRNDRMRFSDRDARERLTCACHEPRRGDARSRDQRKCGSIAPDRHGQRADARGSATVPGGPVTGLDLALTGRCWPREHRAAS